MPRKPPERPLILCANTTCTRGEDAHRKRFRARHGQRFCHPSCRIAAWDRHHPRVAVSPALLKRATRVIRDLTAAAAMQG